MTHHPFTLRLFAWWWAVCCDCGGREGPWDSEAEAAVSAGRHREPEQSRKRRAA